MWKPVTRLPRVRLIRRSFLKVAGVRQVQNYILKEVKKVYQSQGIEISDKHVEVMIRQMLRKVVRTGR